MTDADNELHHFDRRMVWAGFRQLAPISIFVTLFGAAFGLAAVQTGWTTR
jgi:predicted branched-subunit amino acid permease